MNDYFLQFVQQNLTLATPVQIALTLITIKVHESFMVWLNNRNQKQNKLLDNEIKNKEQDRLTTTNYIGRLENDIDELKMQNESLEKSNDGLHEDILELREKLLMVQHQTKEALDARDTYIERVAQLKEQLSRVEAILKKVQSVFGDWLDVLVDDITEEDKKRLDDILSDFVSEIRGGDCERKSTST